MMNSEELHENPFRASVRHRTPGDIASSTLPPILKESKLFQDLVHEELVREQFTLCICGPLKISHLPIILYVCVCMMMYMCLCVFV